MFKTLYHFDLNNQIEKQQACLGRVEDNSKCLGYVTMGGKVMLYSPNTSNTEEQTLHQSLNLNKEITCICFGKGENLNPKEYLYIGSESNLMCYDIASNKTLFDKDMMEGVYCVVSGLYSNYPMPLCIVGGNCSIIGMDYLGEDKFWTVLGGNPICITLADVNGDSLNELLIGTDDFTIRFYQDEHVITEINENTKIIQLESLGNFRFAYALENGTLGLYNSGERAWKVKEKGHVSSIVARDFNRDNQYEILAGWSSGKIQLRQEDQGKIIIELDIANQAISKILYDDFNQRGQRQLIAITQKGEVFGYEYSEYEKYAPSQASFIPKDKTVDPNEIRKYETLLQKKKDLIDKLEKLAIENSNRDKVNSAKDNIVLQKNTTVKIDLQSNNDDKCADLIVESSPGSVIHSVIVMSEQIYKGESYVKYPSSETNNVIIQMITKKDLNINLHIKVLVGTSYFLNDYQVFEFNKIIPKYCFYILLRDEIAYKTNSGQGQGISFTFNDRIDRLILWLELFFNIAKKDLESFRSGDNIYSIKFMSLRTDKVLQINVKNNTLEIFTEEVELAGNIFQDMYQYFKMPEQDTNFHYSVIANDFSALIKRIENLDKTRNQFNINMTEIITFIKDLFVRAEDSRLLQNIDTFKDYFRKINLKNLELLDEFEKRTQTYQDLITDLKQVNEIIQTFSNLKAGSFQSQMVSQCRNCIRKKNYQLLLKIISTGSE